MAITAVLGDGASISIGSAIGEVVSIKFGGGGYDVVDVSNLASIGIRRFLQSKSADGGELTVEYTSAASQTPAAGIHAVTITLSDGTAFSFSAYVTSPDHDISLRNKVTHTVKMKISSDGTSDAGGALI
jgi:hypothetical protein